MSDPTQFIVNLSTVHRLLQHEGIIGLGRDFMTNHPYSLHSYSDKFKRNYTMQLFDSVDSDFVSNKLNSLAKSAHSSFLPNLAKPCLLSTRKTGKNLYEFAAIYDVHGLGDLTLSDLIEAKRSTSEKFDADEISAFFWQIADFLLLSARNNSEYLDINPRNIISKIEGFYGYNFFIMNFSHKSNKKIYHNPGDSFYKGEKSHDKALSAVMFIFGMIILELVTMLPPD